MGESAEVVALNCQQVLFGFDGAFLEVGEVVGTP